VPGAGNPQAYNRYAYTLNNPLKYIDPSGHCSLNGHQMPDTDAACGWASNNQGSLSGNGNGQFNTSVLVGVSSSFSPAANPDFVQNGQEGTCAGCSVEPNLPQGSGAIANGAAVIGDGLTGVLSTLAMNAQDIPVYVNYTTNPDGSISVSSLTVDNTQTGADVSVMIVQFSISGDAQWCYSGNPCIVNAPYVYTVQANPNPSYLPSNINAPGIGVLTGPFSTQTVLLTPSGYPNNPSNTFTNEFTITVTLGNSLTGGLFNQISTTIQP